MDAPRLISSGWGLLEAARWYPSTGLVFSDMTRGGVHRLSVDNGDIETVIPHRKAIGGLVAHESGGFVISGRNVAHKPDPTNTIVLLETRPDEQFFNDLTADGAGRLYVGSVGIAVAGTHEPGPGRLYRIDLDGGSTVLSDDVLVSNGLGVNPQETVLYHVDSLRRIIWKFDVSGLPKRTLFASTAHVAGVPDGLAVGIDGSVWVAMAGGSLVLGWDAAGVPIGELAIPEALVTSVCFGGPELDRMFILTGTNDEFPTPNGGCVFEADAGVRGAPAPTARVQPPS